MYDDYVAIRFFPTPGFVLIRLAISAALKRTSILAVISAIASVSLPVSAEDQLFAISSFDNGNGLGGKMVVIMPSRNTEMCHKLVEAHYKGLRADCPLCRMETEQCTVDLGQYQTVWRNELFKTPYVTWKNKRYVFSGASHAELETACLWSAERLQMVDSSASARCIK